ncbi:MULTISPECIES: hypothetical protein [Deefgea]|uniref:DUF5610 domain-containing protein n=1 Tax=Deefgea chitinilytica TaxID=570276 RepID=A0ABS2CD15_9NEIS|nr:MULTISPECIES: hypothetical protein [Deefgea]MBM5572044.1 hypothetical protein [Deefgea chitinilytica]MBM9889279.1 hypothetical protein [Deefgea sp. CFH1-16]
MSLQISSSSSMTSNLSISKASADMKQIKPSEQTAANTADKVILTGQTPEALTYSKPRVMPAELTTMLEDSERQVEAMMNLIRPLLEQQGLTMSKVISGEQKLTVDQDTIDAAKAAISEDGEMGVRKVSERILSFAKFAIGDDPAQMKKIRDAVELGFTQAKEALGGTLPEISQQTYDTIMAEFDRWEQEGIPSGATVSLRQAEPNQDKLN